VKLAPALGLVLAACGGSGGAVDAGPPADAEDYFALQPGVCFEYATAGGDTQSVDIVAVQSPAGVALARSHSGVLQEKSFLVFDGGLALLAERTFATTGITDVYETPLSYLSIPLDQTTLNSQSSYTEGNSAGMQSLGYETLAVAPDINVQAWTGYGSVASSEEDKISFTFSNGDAGSVSFAWMTPQIGFTDLFLANPAGIYVDYLLTGVHPDDAGCP
jgi:hypothetical protein